VVDQVYVLINESRIIVKNAMEPPFVITTNAGLVVKNVEVEASAVMEN
jgi:hypothetical protein